MAVQLTSAALWTTASLFPLLFSVRAGTVVELSFYLQRLFFFCFVDCVICS